MKRRSSDPLAPLLPVLRLAAVGLVAAAGTLAAVHINANAMSSSPAAATAAAAQNAHVSIPVAAKLVVSPVFPLPGGSTGAQATFTDQAEITRVAQIVNGLPLAPTGFFPCPMDNGSGLDLDFESGGGKALVQVQMKATGCGGSTISVNGEESPRRASNLQTIQRIQTILGTHWQLTPSTYH